MSSRIGHHLSLQCGVISRRQALEAGLRPHDLRRLVRRREWVAVHPGVYVSHTGSLTWVQRPWAAVLLTWPSALCGESALRAADGAGSRERISEDVIHLGVDRRRASLAVPHGIRLHHLARFDDKVLWNLGPPRLGYEEAAPHRLPRALRQARATASVAVVYRDVEYDEGFVVELDGRLFHDSATQRDADFERDLDAAVDDKPTVRLSWGQVFDRPCTTTAKLVVVLRAHGVVVIPRGCAPGCPVGVLGLAA